jgi:hypothetical protein
VEKDKTMVKQPNLAHKKIVPDTVFLTHRAFPNFDENRYNFLKSD